VRKQFKEIKKKMPALIAAMKADLTQVRQAEIVSAIIAIDYDFYPSIFGTTSLSFNR
jgi:hypothetical protein